MTMILHIQNSTPEQRGHGRLGEWGGFGMPRQHHRGDLQVDGDINLDDYEVKRKFLSE